MFLSNRNTLLKKKIASCFSFLLGCSPSDVFHSAFFLTAAGLSDDVYGSRAHSRMILAFHLTNKASQWCCGWRQQRLRAALTYNSQFGLEHNSVVVVVVIVSRRAPSICCVRFFVLTRWMLHLYECKTHNRQRIKTTFHTDTLLASTKANRTAPTHTLTETQTHTQPQLYTGPNSIELNRTG